jgi:hypothetical protein
MFAERLVMLALSCALNVSALSVTAQARDDISKVGSATACANSNHRGCVSAQVRPVKIELHMRNPSSKVAWCKNDCLATLRKNSVEFWSGQSDKF